MAWEVRAGPAARRPDQGQRAAQPQGAAARLGRGSEVRILFVFDPRRQVVLLVAGDKAGVWKSWYPKAITAAERRYEQYLEETEGDA